MVNLKAAQQRSIGAAAAHCRATGIDQFDDRRIFGDHVHQIHHRSRVDSGYRRYLAGAAPASSAQVEISAGGHERLDRLWRDACHALDTVGCAVVTVVPVKPGHGGDVRSV